MRCCQQETKGLLGANDIPLQVVVRAHNNSMEAVILILISTILLRSKPRLREIRQTVQCPRTNQGQSQYSNTGFLALKGTYLKTAQAKINMPGDGKLLLNGDKLW